MSAPQTCIIVYESLSQVHRLKRHLYEGGVYVDMIRAPHSLGIKGCSFALRCSSALMPEIRRTSQALAIEIRGQFAESANGYEPLP